MIDYDNQVDSSWASVFNGTSSVAVTKVPLDITALVAGFTLNKQGESPITYDSVNKVIRASSER